ncbi:hypothetical protein PI126_g5038 [Phytophthora idaei]|nr:hypothetical protein PI126_g5038 [Phytophthora idaei]
MPFTMGIVNVLNSLCWALYSGLVGNLFILAPNITGLALGTTQMVLTYVYRRKPQTDDEIISATIENPYDKSALSVVVVSPVLDGRYDRKLSYVDPSFVAMQSPCRVYSKPWHRNLQHSRVVRATFGCSYIGFHYHCNKDRYVRVTNGYIRERDKNEDCVVAIHDGRRKYAKHLLLDKLRCSDSKSSTCDQIASARSYDQATDLCCGSPVRPGTVSR